MTNLKGKTALITGASSGIGKACAERLAAQGANLVILARRVDRLEQMAQELTSKHPIKVYPFQADVRFSKQLEAVSQHLQKESLSIDILINNAGLALATDLLQQGSLENWDVMIDTNIKGLLYTTRIFLPSMVERNSGHIINIGSVAGHGSYLAGNVYSATKHAVRALSKSLRLDLIGTRIRVSEIDPGAVNTEFSEVRWKDKARADKFYEGFQPLVADDIADAVVYCLTRPQHVNISELVIYPQAQASLTDLYREGQPVKNLFNSK